MATLFQPFTELWKRLSYGQRAGLVVGVAVIAAIVAGTVSYSTRPVFVTMYSGLNASDASSIVEDLREKNIPFEVSGDGSTVRVPQESLGELRLQFAAEGVPSSGEIGYELFDKPMLGMTDFMQHMNQHRALEGELSKTIGQLASVENVRVHLVLPEQRLFREDQKPPTASIVLQLKPGAMLADEQVQSIAYMTAYAVEGLDIEHITIVDTKGNLLSGRTSRDELAGLSASQLEVQHAVEVGLEKKALALLENALGPEKSQVKVTAELNWDRVERTVENYDADRTATLSEERQEATGDQTEQGGGSSERSVTNYQVPRTVEKFVPETGNVERLSASVIVDGVRTPQKKPDGTDTTTYRDRTPEEIDKIRNLVASAIGFVPDRNDELTVVSFPLTTPSAAADLSPIQGDPKALWLKMIEKGVLVVMFILLFLLARSLLTKVGKQLPALPEAGTVGALGVGTAGMLGAGTDGASLSMPGGDLSQAMSGLGNQAGGGGSAGQNGDFESGQPRVIMKSNMPVVEFEDVAPSVDAIKHQELLRRATEYIIKKPENATQILRSWISDDSAEKPHR